MRADLARFFASAHTTGHSCRAINSAMLIAPSTAGLTAGSAQEVEEPLRSHEWRRVGWKTRPPAAFPTFPLYQRITRKWSANLLVDGSFRNYAYEWCRLPRHRSTDVFHLLVSPYFLHIIDCCTWNASERSARTIFAWNFVYEVNLFVSICWILEFIAMQCIQTTRRCGFISVETIT